MLMHDNFYGTCHQPVYEILMKGWHITFNILAINVLSNLPMECQWVKQMIGQVLSFCVSWRYIVVG
jgi:hypothetical protein